MKIISVLLTESVQSLKFVRTLTAKEYSLSLEGGWLIVDDHIMIPYTKISEVKYEPGSRKSERPNNTTPKERLRDNVPTNA